MSIYSRWRACVAPALALASMFLLATLSPASAQQPAADDHPTHMQHDHSKMQHDQMQMPQGNSPPATDKKPAKKSKKPAVKSSGANHGNRQMPHAMPAGMHDMAGRDGAMTMRGFLGPYASTREGSGTSWLPDATPHEGVHAQYGDWSTMWHALINGVYDHQGGPRGGDKTFASGMIMGMAQRSLGDDTLGFRAMLSPEPFMGPSGYPLLLATGETANGRDHLVDRQHPHDLFMELATTYSHNLSANSSVFLYAGLPGEPALGPTAFMHRTSGMDIPEAPITHHWLDSTHITFGVVTAGVVLDTLKLEASTFRGREPDQHRYDIEGPKLDSVSARLSWNPTREWSMQVSWGRLHSPEQLDPNVNESRVTASATYTKPIGDSLWSTTFAWGRKMLQPGDTLDGFLLESALLLNQHVTLFARAEHVRENELFDEAIALGQFGSANLKFNVAKASFGGIYDFIRTDHAKFGVGALVSVYDLPGQLAPFYGDPTSTMVFVRLKVM
jgi:hypothetical protein